MAAGALLAIALTSLPLFGDENMHVADDIWYHLLRIDNIRAGLLSGQFPVRMGTNYLNHYGYASNLCYPELFLYVPAVFRLLGLSVTGSYKLFIILVNTTVFGTMYYAAVSITKKRMAGLMAAVFVLLSPYHLANIYLRGALGEVQTYMFYPLVALGLYQLVYEDFDRPWILGLGFWGLMYCHSISLVLGLLTAVGVCLFHFKKVFLNKKKLIRVFVTAAITLLACCSYWLPFLEQLVGGNMKFNEPWTFVSWQGVSWKRLFSFQADRYNFGFLLLGLAIVAFAGAVGRKVDAVQKKAALFFLVGGAAMLFCATEYFPWALVEKVLNNIQFPWRFYALASVFLGIGVAVSICAFDGGSRRRLYLGTVLVCGIVLLDAGLYMRRNPMGYVHLAFDGGYSSGSGTFEIIQREWLPLSVDFEALKGKRQVLNETGEAIAFQTDKRGFISFEADGCSSEYEVPFIWYKGYGAQLVTDDGQTKLDVTADGTTGLTKVFLEEGQAGTVWVGYTGTLLQKGTDVVEGVTMIVLAGYAWMSRRKNADEAMDGQGNASLPEA